MNTTNQTPKQILNTVFGFQSFLPLQEEIINNVLARKDSLVIMPTGGGKSLCYQIPALIFPGLTIVVSPLISLMKDQVQQLNQAGIPAVVLNSSLTFEEYDQNVERLLNGWARLLYIAPESLLTPRVSAVLAGMQIDCLTIDEAHCISEWGHDFRPEYRQLIEVRKRFPEAVCLALTATATARVRQDIKTSLGFRQSNEFIASFDRPNLYLEVAPKVDASRQLLRFLRRFPGQPGIIYCFSRKQVDDLAALLVERGFAARPYHAGLTSQERETNQDLFLRDDVQIIVATIAFGMGINKSNVRFVVHYDLPKSIESYYQEIGRAGRDGLNAHCLLLFNYGDTKKQEFFLAQKDPQERRVAQQHLDALVDYADNHRTCRRMPLLQYFGERYRKPNCGMCDHCRTLDENAIDITTPALKYLSCVARTGEKFGAAHVTDVLLGSKGQKVLANGHDQLSTYGIGKDLSREQWLHISAQLLRKGYLAQDEQYQTLRLTPDAYSFFKTRAPLMGTLLEEKETKPRSSDEGYDRDLFEVLRMRRKQLADAARVPPYVVFSDRTLADMAARYPTTLERMESIYGVGARKLEQYGEDFARLIAVYCKEHQIQPPEDAARPARVQKPAAPGPESSVRHVVIGRAYLEGLGLEALAQRYNIQPDTVINHLARCLLEGMRLPPRENLLEGLHISADLRQSALAAFEQHGTVYLKPVFDALEGRVNFDDLKQLRLYCIMQKMDSA
ncbi:MAG TPA: DNA helicase RecQ [Anaerolineaceae bacterium]